MSIFKRWFSKRSKADPNQQQAPAAFAQYTVVLDEIGSEVLSCIPDNWNNAVFSITCDGRRIDYALENQQDEEGQASISSELAQLAEKLYTTMAGSGNQWTQAELRYDQNGDSWSFKSQFAYA